MKILKSNQILLLDDPKEYIIDLFVRLCQLNYFTKTRDLVEYEQIEVMLILEAINMQNNIRNFNCDINFAN